MSTAAGQQDVSSSGEKKKGVSFGEVRVREHERILNKRPSSLYVGLELGWGHEANSEHHMIDDFEKTKEEKHQEHKRQGYERLQTLIKYGYSPKDVLALENEKKRRLELREQGIEVPEEDNEVDFLEPPQKDSGIKSWLETFGLM